MASAITQTPSSKSQFSQISTRKLLWAGPAAGAVAAIANVIVFLITTGPMSMPLNMPQFPSTDVLMPLPIVAVLASSVIGGILGAVALAIVARFASRPNYVFQIVAAVAVVLSFGMILALPGTIEFSTKLVLGVMHIVAWAAVATLLPRLARAS